MHFGNDPRPGDRQPIMAEKDEYVVNRNAARKHKNLLDFINYVDEPRFDSREMGDSAINEAIALNTLSQFGMQSGGEVESKTLKDMVDPYLPRKDDMLPFLEFLTGATAETDEYQPGAVDAAMAIPVLGGIGRFGKKGYATLSRLLRRYGKEGRELDRVFGKGSAKKALEPGSDLTTDTKYYREVGIDSPRKEPISWDEMEEIRKTAGDEYGFGSKFDIFGAEGKYPPGFTRDKFGAIFGKTVDDVTGETFEKFRLSPSGKHLPTDAKFQQGGLIDDKSKRKGGYSLGVKDELAESVDYFQDLDKILSAVRHQDRYDFGKSERSTIDWLGESGIMDVESALKHLDHIQKRYHEGTVGFHMPRYQTGGNVSYGGETIERPSLTDIYTQAGVMPNAEQLPSFESSFGQLGDDRFVGTRGDYSSTISNIIGKGTGAIGKATADSASVGVGFGKIGIEEAIKKEVRDSAERGVMMGRDDAKRALFEQERSINEGYLTDGINELRRLESVGGTIPYPPPSDAGSIFFGEEGTGYMGTGFGGGAFGGGVDNTDATGPQTSPLVSPGSYDGETVEYNGDTYIWDGSSWQIQTTGATGGTGLSDKRLKKDINHLFTMSNGVPIYTFKYNWSDDVEIGTMAQDIEEFMPDAVSEMNGYKLVDYRQVFK